MSQHAAGDMPMGRSIERSLHAAISWFDSVMALVLRPVRSCAWISAIWLLTLTAAAAAAVAESPLSAVENAATLPEPH